MTEAVKIEPGLYRTKDDRYEIRREPDGSSWYVWDVANEQYVDGGHYFEVLRDATRWVARNL